ncbi:GCR1-dependent translation factor 1 [Cladophialophora chaetospira]|uniref:GCR1-dependent translation factor 1 n=1 Tax=Cladophialophora chaetospira TaxID=386627 RepID=A0AA38X5Z7_9EURO|nr:GCR1-dependent translation factor 1 [Cladophialophora chaetospira]
MKMGRRRAQLLLLLFVSVATTNALGGDLSSSDLLNKGGSGGAVGASGGGNTIKGSPVGTEHAPVDGRDGMPHDGPFVETSGERTRKKQGAGEEENWGMKPYKDHPDMPELPLTNDAVMDDRVNSNPIEGTRGVEGGISEKSKEINVSEKKPESPKDARPLPHNELRDTSGSEAPVSSEEEAEKPLAVPEDLPSKPHDIPYPENPSSPKDDILSSESPQSTPRKPQQSEHEPAVISPMHSLLLSFTMIIFSEIGDKTFLVAALMAMRHPRVVVFTAAYAALITMTVLSAVLGHAVPTLIPETVTKFAAAGLFLVFGVKMLIEARGISPDEGVSEEMKEVEMELEEKEHQQARRMSRHRRRSSVMSPYALEAGRGIPGRKNTDTRLPSPPESPSSSREVSPSRGSALKNAAAGINNLFSLLLSPAWVQTFVMTFLGEWGDRSQIATIAMAAGQDYWWVTAGALVGHGICTGAAVLGGRAIAGKVSLRTVTMGGAIAFLVFGVIYLLEAVY